MNIQKNKEFLQFLCSSGKKNRRFLIASANRKQINSICEIILNVLKGNVPISDDLKHSLSKKKKLIRDFVKKSTLKNKKSVLQKGGFIEFLIPAIISGLSTIASALIEKA